MYIMDDTFNEIGAKVHKERQRQNAKWGPQHHVDPHWFVILSEEMGEVARAVYERDDPGELEKEIVQVAAVAFAWLEDMMGRPGRFAEMEDELGEQFEFVQTEETKWYFVAKKNNVQVFRSMAYRSKLEALIGAQELKLGLYNFELRKDEHNASAQD